MMFFQLQIAMRFSLLLLLLHYTCRLSATSVTSRLLSELFGRYEPEELVRTTQRPVRYKTYLVPDHNEECGITKSTDRTNGRRFKRVVGGYEAPRGSHPYIVNIRFMNKETNKWGHLCGGTLIHPQYILTAAHCFDDGENDPKRLAVVVGDWNKDKKDGTEQRHSVKRVHIHPYYRDVVRHDIAILEFKSRVKLNKHVALACLPNSDFDYYEGRLCMVNGWGHSDPSYGEDDDIADKLRVGHVPIIDWDECKATSEEYHILSTTSFCAGYFQGGIDTCQGDSGGPFVCQANNGAYTVVGVTSWGIGCAQENNPGVYTTVVDYLDWITKILKYRTVTIAVNDD